MQGNVFNMVLKSSITFGLRPKNPFRRLVVWLEIRENSLGQSLAAICHPHMEFYLISIKTNLKPFKIHSKYILSSGKLSKYDVFVAALSVPYKYPWKYIYWQMFSSCLNRLEFAFGSCVLPEICQFRPLLHLDS